MPAGIVDIIVPFEQEGTKAVVRAWLRKPGERVAENDPLVELETDKVTQEVPAPAAGVLVEVVLDTDAEAVPGAVLGRLRIGEAAGAPGHEAEVDGPVADRDLRPEDSGAGSGREGGAAGMPAAGAGGGEGRETRLSPSVRRAVRAHGLDPLAIAGSGKGGRVTRADVDAFVAARATRQPVAARGAGEADAGRESQAGGSDGMRRVPHDRMRRAIAENLTASVTSAPHVTAVFECDMSAIIAHRAAHRAALEAAGTRLTYTAYFVKAAAEAMRAVPEINARWHDDRLDIFDEVNIGVGTALGDKGLVVPVVQRAEAKPLEAIARDLDDLTRRARADALTPADMRGGTFTISNHGVSGSLFASPIIIVQPQSAILGVGKTEKRVVVREVGGVDTIQIRPMAYVSLTIDHRVVDGHQTNAWLTRFVELIEGWGAE